VLTAELARRLPDARIEAYAPCGSERVSAFHGVHAAASLGPWTPERAAALARRLDLFVVGGGEIVHPHDAAFGHVYGMPGAELTRRQPTGWFLEGVAPGAGCALAWNAVGVPFALEEPAAGRVRRALAHAAYVAVRDPASAERLVACGVDCEVHVVPDTALLVHRLLPRPELQPRLDGLRASGRYPRCGRPLVIQGSSDLVRQGLAPLLAAAVREAQVGHPIPVVLLQTGPCLGDGELVDQLRNRLGASVYDLGVGRDLADLAAAIAGARAFVGTSLHGALTALAYEVPFRVVDVGVHPKLAGFARTVDRPDVTVSPPGIVREVGSLVGQAAPTIPKARRRELVARVDQHFDELAAAAVRSAAQTSGAGSAART
jgi:polysaccharide pyruvyl transferase